MVWITAFKYPLHRCFSHIIADIRILGEDDKYKHQTGVMGDYNKREGDSAVMVT